VLTALLKNPLFSWVMVKNLEDALSNFWFSKVKTPAPEQNFIFEKTNQLLFLEEPRNWTLITTINFPKLSNKAGGTFCIVRCTAYADIHKFQDQFSTLLEVYLMLLLSERDKWGSLHEKLTAKMPHYLTLIHRAHNSLTSATGLKNCIYRGKWWGTRLYQEYDAIRTSA
jgi:hypothetical protein